MTLTIGDLLGTALAAAMGFILWPVVDKLAARSKHRANPTTADDPRASESHEPTPHGTAATLPAIPVHAGRVDIFDVSGLYVGPVRLIDRLLVGEALVGNGAEVAHVTVVMGPRGSAAEASFCSSLTTREDHFIACRAALSADLPRIPNVVLFNTLPIKTPEHERLLRGPAYQAISKALTDCVNLGVLPQVDIDDIFLCVGVFLHSTAEDEELVRRYNYYAASFAVQRAVTRLPTISDVINRTSLETPSIYREIW